MATPGDLPRYFCTLTSLRPLASCVFLYFAYHNGHVAAMMGDTKAHAIARDIEIHNQGYQMLKSSLAISATVAVWAGVWGFVNVIGEASEAVRRAALKGCWRSDTGVVAISAMCIVLNRVAISRSQCSGYGIKPGAEIVGNKETMKVEMWCSRYEDGFRFTVAMLVLAAIPLFFSTRWLIKKRLSESRSVSHDWTKNRSPRSQPYLAFLQCLAAPIRFIWRCCCKLGHSSKNPTMWAIIFAVFTVPLMIGFAIIGIFRVGKGISKGAHAITSSKSRKPAAEDLDETDTRMSTAMEPTNTSDDDIEMVSPHSHDHRPRGGSTKPEKIRCPTLPAPSAEVGYWREKISRSRPNMTAKSPTMLDRLIEHPNLFFELLSHLHGADVRVLSTVSHSVRNVILYHRTNHPRAVRKYTCMRADSSTTSRASRLSPATSSSNTSPSNIASAIRNILGSDAIPAEHKSHACWSCGVVVCSGCSEAKPLLRVSKAELRLHSLQPVCSACYFKCLCGPHAPQPRTWYGMPRNPHRRIFPSLSAKCACTSQKPPKLEHQLCRDCCKLELPGMWKKRAKRGAVAEAHELPPNAAINTTYEQSESGSESDPVAVSDDIEAIAGMKETADVNVAKQDTLFIRPMLATRITHCYGCQERLWILPRWLGFGETRGLRWWRCRRCGLEARDVLMSLRREFQ